MASPGAALRADHPSAEIRDFGFSRIAPHIDQRGVAAGVVEARRNQPLDADRSHIAERHWRAGGCLGLILEEFGKTLQQFGVSERLHELLCDLGNSLLEKHLRLINDARRAIKGMVVQNAPNRL